jgi:glutathione-regulated potassium-efflux system ancillary protein KefF
MILVVYAHPYPDRSRANRALLDAASSLDGVEVRSLYDLYPDFAIDVGAEQSALERCDAVVFQHPMYWYAAPALMKLWFEKVLTPGWAYGEGGEALRGKRCLWAVTTGGDAHAYTEAGIHQHSFDAFVPVMHQTVALCHMIFEPPFIVHAAHRASRDELMAHAEAYRARVVELITEAPDA